mgnify:CR=1 FL=1
MNYSFIYWKKLKISKTLNQAIKKKNINLIALESARNGNIHSFIGIFDKGLDAYANYTHIIDNASSNGFYKFLKFIVIILEKQKQNGNLFDSSYSYQNITANLLL